MDKVNNMFNYFISANVSNEERASFMKKLQQSSPAQFAQLISASLISEDIAVEHLAQVTSNLQTKIAKLHHMDTKQIRQEAVRGSTVYGPTSKTLTFSPKIIKKLQTAKLKAQTENTNAFHDAKAAIIDAFKKAKEFAMACNR